MGGSSHLGYVPPAQQELARWLVQHERAAVAQPTGPLGPAAEVLRKLSPGVTALVTTAGYRALLARALHLTRPRSPFLESVHVTDGDAFIEGPRTMGGETVEESSVALIGGLLALLVSLIGADLTNTLIRGAWPDAPLRRAEPGPGGRP